MERRGHKQEQNNAVSHSEERQHPKILSIHLNLSSETQKYKCKNMIQIIGTKVEVYKHTK